MDKTRDTESWLDANEPDDDDDKDDLIKSVKNIKSVGQYSTTESGGKFLVEGPLGNTLVLPNEKSRLAFIARLEKIEVPDDLDAGFRRSVDDPHS